MKRMKETLRVILAVTACVVLMPASAEGHHGWATFESQVTVTFKATVTDFHFVNPHSVVEFDEKDDKGNVHTWQGEFGSPIHLAPKGWTASSLEAGDEITITGYRAKNGARSLRVTRIVLSNGRELKLDSGQ
ncbi:MAG: hypothetical protein QOJ99_2198 [Bryobacterales bacterium]|jgi:hypothetical protein|nr:hypothetical protein [Bryobacterales bacterium]